MQRLSVARSRFFWKLYLTHSGLFLIIVTVVGWFLYQAFQNSLIQNVRNSLHDKLSLLAPEAAPIVTSNNPEAAQARISDLAARTKIRITLLDKEGRLYADSNTGNKDLSSQVNQPEFQEALRHEVGFSHRMQPGAHDEFMYMAKALYEGEKRVGFIRVSLPMSGIYENLEEMAAKIALTSLAGVLAALLVGLLLTRRAAIPILEMMRVCEALRQGRYDLKVTTLPNDEIGLLGDTLNRLGKAITEQIARISLDRAQLKTILANMVEGIIAIDNENRIQFCNQAAYQFLNPQLTDCRGMRIETVEGFDRLADLVDEARQTKRLAEEEIRIRDMQTNRFLECYASTLRGAEASGIIVVIHDISDVRKLEGVRRDFVTNVSHELKTPLTAIKGYTETLLSGALDDQVNARRFVEKIEVNANRLVTLVKDIIRLAQTEAESEEVQLQPVNWQDVVGDVLSRYDDDITNKGLLITVENQASEMQVLGDREAMVQVLENLVSNAIRYTPASGKLGLRIYREQDYGWLAVTDTGIGIKQKHLDRIFQRFYRVDKARSREVGGTGLGLSIVQHLVTMMRGSILVESELGVGSTFKVRLPVAP